jgi:hypothetical protein
MFRHVVVAILSIAAAATVRAQHGSITGAWTLNRDLSTNVPQGREPGEQRPRGGRSNGSPGGMGGAMGRGGLGFPGMGGGPSEDDMHRMGVIRRRLTEVPERLTIVRDGDRVTLTDGEGRIVSLKADGKKQERLTGDGEFTSRTRFEGEALVVDEDFGGGVKLTTRIAPVEDASTRQIEVVLKATGLPKGSQMPPRRDSDDRPRDSVRRVYDAAER